jgi:hypothetical protein
VELVIEIQEPAPTAMVKKVVNDALDRLDRFEDNLKARAATVGIADRYFELEKPAPPVGYGGFPPPGGYQGSPVPLPPAPQVPPTAAGHHQTTGDYLSFSKQRRKLWLGVGAVLAGLLAAYIVAAPYITVHQMKVAAEKRDGNALSKLIDFPSLRQSFKEQLNAQVANATASERNPAGNPFAAAGSAFGMTIAEGLIDNFVTPETITSLMAGANPNTDNIKQRNDGRDPFSSVSMGYQSLDTFAVTVKTDDGHDDGKFILRRRGIGWKLTEIVLPP